MSRGGDCNPARHVYLRHLKEQGIEVVRQTTKKHVKLRCLYMDRPVTFVMPIHPRDKNHWAIFQKDVQKAKQKVENDARR